jgi:glycosyltransferase involved in cell wall biosynthesis
MISLSMIVRNEEKYLPDCLKSVRGIAGEIIIVDTGSTDRTIEIARSFGAKIFSFKWVDDFSAARNFALERSTGEWILYLDADERLNPNSINEIKRITAVKNNCAYYCNLTSIDEINNHPSIMKYVRLFPNQKNIRFEGKIHEQIEPAIVRNNIPVKDSQIKILHVGYSLPQNELKRKAERNLSILLKEYEVNPSSYYAFQIGQTYGILNNSEVAIKYFKSAIEDIKLKNEYKSVALRYIALNFAQKQQWQKAEEYITMSLNYDNEQPVALLGAAKIFFNLKKYEEAKFFCLKALEVNKKFLSGGEGSYQAICLNERTISYEGLSIAISAKDKESFNFYYHRLKDIKSEAIFLQLELIDGLLNNKPLNRIERFSNIIDEENLDLILSLLAEYKNNKMDIYEFLYSSFFSNPGFLNNFGSFLYNEKEYERAEKIFENSFSINPDIPSTVFYLISAYLQNRNLTKIETVLVSAEKRFADQPEVISRINRLKTQLFQFVKSH